MKTNKIEDEKILTQDVKDSINEKSKELQEVEFTKEEQEIITNDTKEYKEKHRTFIIDCETGGLNPYTDGLCSVAISEKDTKLIHTHYLEPQRGKFYGQSAFDVNRMDLEILEDLGEQKELVCLNLKQLMGRSCTLIGHNIEFDLKFLLQLFKECKAKLPIIHYIDTLAMAKKHLIKRTKTNNGQVEDFKLSTLYKYYFNDFDENLAHTANYDVFMTEKIYNELMKLEK